MISPKQTWKPKGNYLDSVNRGNGSYTLKQFEATERFSRTYAIIDSGALEVTQNRASCQENEERTVREPLELLHMDLFGPVSVESINKKKLRHKVKPSRCEQGTEFKNQLMNSFCAKKNQDRIYIARTPQQNGVAEERIGLYEAARQLEPKKVSQALADESWVEAMQEELLQFKLQEVWVLCDLPEGKRVIGTKWVFRNKEMNGIEAILEDSFGICIFHGFTTVYQMDVKMRFLYGNNHKEVYSNKTSKFEDPIIQTKVYRVVQALTPHQAPRALARDMISEATIRADLLFDDENGVDCFPKQVIWDTLRDIGYEGNLAQYLGESMLTIGYPESRGDEFQSYFVVVLISHDILVVKYVSFRYAIYLDYLVSSGQGVLVVDDDTGSNYQLKELLVGSTQLSLQMSMWDNFSKRSKLEYKFQDKENSEDIFSFGSALEDYITLLFVLVRNIKYITVDGSNAREKVVGGKITSPERVPMDGLLWEGGKERRG
ncbi:putative ribonuclease H-like domain-containing protein [Tanacetum coccineum]